MGIVESVKDMLGLKKSKKREGQWEEIRVPQAEMAIAFWKRRIPGEVMDLLRADRRVRYIFLHPYPAAQSGGHMIWDSNSTKDDGWVHSFPPSTGYLFLGLVEDRDTSDSGTLTHVLPLDETTLRRLATPDGLQRKIEDGEAEPATPESDGGEEPITLSTLRMLFSDRVTAEQYRAALDALRGMHAMMAREEEERMNAFRPVDFGPSVLTMHTERNSTREELTASVLGFLSQRPEVEAICYEVPSDENHETHTPVWTRADGWVGVPSATDSIKVLVNYGANRVCQPLRMALEALHYDREEPYSTMDIRVPDWDADPTVDSLREPDFIELEGGGSIAFTL